MAKILVIGAGVGGATAAALLAKKGHAVTVLEAHIYPGGCAGTFYHQKYRFDAGATLAGGFHPGGPHDVVGKALGINWKIHPAEPAWQVHLPDRVVTRYGDENAWHAEIARVFPAQSLNFFRDMAHVSDAVWAFAARQPAWPLAGVGDVIRTARALRPSILATLPHLFETVATWARRKGLTDPAALTFLNAQLLISAQATADNASALFGAAAYDLPRKGVNHVEGGIGTIALQLVEAVRKFGGQVHYRQEVTRLETHNGRIIAAHTNKGERFECDYCIANLTPWDLARLLGDAAPTSLTRETRTRPDEWGAFTLYLGIENDSSISNPQSPNPTSDHFQVIADYAKPLGEGNSIFMSFSMAGDASRAPVGHRALTISTHTRAADWWALRESPNGPAKYEARVAQYSEKMLDLAERAVPGLRRRIQLQLPGTPVTFKFYTRRHRGGVGGFPFTSIFNTRGPHTGFANARLVGDSIFPGQSTAGVTMGALRVAGEI